MGPKPSPVMSNVFANNSKRILQISEEVDIAQIILPKSLLKIEIGYVEIIQQKVPEKVGSALGHFVHVTVL